MDEFLQDIDVAKDIKQKLRKLCGMLLTKNRLLDDIFSGVVIAGFGRDEMFPCIRTFEIETKVGRYLKSRYIDRKSHQIEFDNDVSVMAFAQGEVVSAFMEGIDPDYRRHILGKAEEMLSQLSNYLISEATGVGKEEEGKVSELLASRGEELLKDFHEDMHQYERNRHIHPIILNVRHLPKDELAQIAQTLVNLTSFKRRVSVEEETVGGPIDVAVISKGDGFIWIRRKHYFSADQNPQFFANYYRK